MDDMYSWIDLFLYSMYLENCNEILNHTYNFIAILHVYTCTTRQDINFFNDILFNKYFSIPSE